MGGTRLVRSAARVRQRRLTILGALITLFVVVAAGCGSSGKSSKSSSSGGSDSSASTVKQPTGKPIKVLALYGELTRDDNNAGIQAAVKAINANGGIKGRPVVVTTCSDNNDANTAAKCARDAADDPDVVAVVDHSTSFGATTLPVLEKAGLAALGTQVFGVADAKSPAVFASSSGIFNSIGAAKVAVQLLDAKRIGVPYVDVPAGAQLAPFINIIVKPLGAEAVGVIPVPPTAADVTSQIANEIAAKPDVIIDGLTVEAFTKFIQGTRQQGSDVPFLVSGGVFDASQVKDRLNGANNNIYIVGEYNHQSAGFKDFKADMDKYNKSYGNRNDSVLSGWIAIKQLEYAANKATTIDRKGIMDAMNATTDFDLGGLTEPIDYSKPQTGLGGALPRVINDAVYLYKYEDGKEVPVKGSPPNHLFSK